MEALEDVLPDLKRMGKVEASTATSGDGLLMKAIMPMGQHAETLRLEKAFNNIK